MIQKEAPEESKSIPVEVVEADAEETTAAQPEAGESNPESPSPQQPPEGESGGAEAPPAPTLEEQLAETRTELQETHDRYLRLYAEFDNFKKRSARDFQEFRKFANEYLVRDLLPVIDNLERALSSANERNQESIIQGVEMTLQEIRKVLEKFHCKPISSIGQPFDPALHEAVSQEESAEHGDNIVIREFQKGYLLHDRLIRPAMVVVSKAAPVPETGEGDNPPRQGNGEAPEAAAANMDDPTG
jgi:molecular chaperone GrpE